MKRIILLIALVTIVAPQATRATKKIYSPIVEYRELEFELRAGVDNDHSPARDGAQKYKAAVGYGPVERLFFEVYGEFEKAPSTSSEFEAIEVEVRYQLFEQGQYGVDAGLYAEYAARTQGAPDKIEGKLLLEKSVGGIRNILNLKLEKEFDPAVDAEVGAAWSSRYRLDRRFEPGVEVYSDFGEITNPLPAGSHAHYVGPVVYGKLGKWKYDVGYLFGLTEAARDGRLKVLLEYEVHL